MGTGSTTASRGRGGTRILRALGDSSVEVGEAWSSLQRSAGADIPPMGLAAGERPTADVEVLAGAFAVAEYELARRMHAAQASGCLPFPGPGSMLTARSWSTPSARRLARAGALAAEHPSLAQVWASGIITSEHVDAVARHADLFEPDELAAVIAELGSRWGRWSPSAITRFVRAADRLLHPRAEDPEPSEADAYATRGLSFAITSDSVILSGELPRLEGELVMAAIDAFAEKLRSTVEHVPASARRADALVALVNAAHAAGALPTRGGLPVALTVTLDHTSFGDPIWSTSRGHLLTEAEARFTACDAAITPVLFDTTSGHSGTAEGHVRTRLRICSPRRDAHGATGGRGGGPGRLGRPQTWPRGSPPSRPRCSTHGSRWPSGGPSAPPPPPSGGPWRPATRDASSPGAAWPPRRAKFITSPSGRRVAARTPRIWSSSVGHIIVRWTS